MATVDPSVFLANMCFVHVFKKWIVVFCCFPTNINGFHNDGLPGLQLVQLRPQVVRLGLDMSPCVYVYHIYIYMYIYICTICMIPYIVIYIYILYIYIYVYIYIHIWLTLVYVSWCSLPSVLVFSPVFHGPFVPREAPPSWSPPLVPHGWARGARFPASCSPACARSCARCLGLPGDAGGKTSPALGDLVLSNLLLSKETSHENRGIWVTLQKNM